MTGKGPFPVGQKIPPATPQACMRVAKCNPPVEPDALYELATDYLVRRTIRGEIKRLFFGDAKHGGMHHYYLVTSDDPGDWKALEPIAHETMRRVKQSTTNVE